MIRVHLAGCIAALLLGGLVAWLPKGTPVHRLLGWCYVLATVVYAGSALTIFPSTGHFTPFHAIAVQSFALVGLGIGAGDEPALHGVAHMAPPVHALLVCRVGRDGAPLRPAVPRRRSSRPDPRLHSGSRVQLVVDRASCREAVADAATGTASVERLFFLTLGLRTSPSDSRAIPTRPAPAARSRSTGTSSA